MMDFSVVITLLYVQVRLLLMRRNTSTCRQFVIQLLGMKLSRCLRIISDVDAEEEAAFEGNSIE